MLFLVGMIIVGGLLLGLAHFRYGLTAVRFLNLARNRFIKPVSRSAINGTGTRGIPGSPKILPKEAMFYKTLKKALVQCQRLLKKLV